MIRTITDALTFSQCQTDLNLIHTKEYLIFRLI